MRILIVVGFLAASAFARPQEFVSEDEVELVPPVNTNTEVEGGDRDPVVVVLRIPNIGGGDGDNDGGEGFPGFSGFPGFGGDSPFSGLFPGNGPRIPQIPRDPFDIFDDIFSGGLPRDDVVDEGEVELVDPVDTTPNRPHNCGLLCAMFGIFRGLQGEIDTINKEIHGGGPFPGLIPDSEADVNNSTYEVKVLEDGTKVAVNKTVYADTDENGNSFFVQTTFTHTLGGGDNQVPALLPPTDEYEYDYKPEEIAPAEAEVPEEEVEALPTEDPSINEIDGVDEGLKEE